METILGATAGAIVVYLLMFSKKKDGTEQKVLETLDNSKPVENKHPIIDTYECARCGKPNIQGFLTYSIHNTLSDRYENRDLCFDCNEEIRRKKLEEERQDNIKKAEKEKLLLHEYSPASKCPKCEHGHVSETFAYNSYTEMEIMQRKCEQCGYMWSEKPLTNKGQVMDWELEHSRNMRLS